MNKAVELRVTCGCISSSSLSCKLLPQFTLYWYNLGTNVKNYFDINFVNLACFSSKHSVPVVCLFARNIYRDEKSLSRYESSGLTDVGKAQSKNTVYSDLDNRSVHLECGSPERRSTCLR